MTTRNWELNRKKPMDVIWVLFDLANGDALSKYYTWWFPTKKEATQHLRDQRTRPNSAGLVGPFKYVLNKNKDLKLLKDKLDKELVSHEETKAKLEKASNRIGLINAFNF